MKGGGGGGGGGGQLERYEKLGLAESLPRTHKHPIACKELSFILRGAYSKFPKKLQNLVFQDTLTAFRLLPKMQTQNAVEAARLLSQSAEAVLPKRKRDLAVKEFKHAKIALIHERRNINRQEKGSTQLPQDVLVHIFSFLDLQSLLSSASVCWLWNSTASDNYLWHVQYVHFFSDSDSSMKGLGFQSCGMLEKDKHIQLREEVNTVNSINWRDTFKIAYKGKCRKSSKKLAYYRGYCGHCYAIVWLSNMKCSNENCRLSSKPLQINPIPISPEQIVEYIVNGTPFMVSSSDSDSDGDPDEDSISKLWAFPRYLGK